MQAKRRSPQVELFSIPLERIINQKHPLRHLADTINWSEFDESFGKCYSVGQGRPAKPTRLMVGLHYLKHTFNLSDEEVVKRWVENPYWQYFCGMKSFTHKFPIEPSLMTKWRNRITSEGLEKLFKETIHAGLKTGTVKRGSLKKLNVDTTVQEKAISYPTDAKLYDRMREHLVKLSKESGVNLRQNYNRKSKQSLLMRGRYSHARQMKRARKEQKKVKNYLGRVIRDIERKISSDEFLTDKFSDIMALANRLYIQKKNDKQKLYSIHAPEVECISKGKVHKRYEFGCKVSVVTTSRDNFIVGIHALHGSPYDGHTLDDAISQAERLGDFKASEVYVDRGYRGHNYRGSATVHMVRRGMKKLKRSLRGWLKRRSAIEPVIGHVKNDGRLGRNYLKGVEGDLANALLSGCGYNMRKILAGLLYWLFYRWQIKPSYSIIQLNNFPILIK